MPAIGILVMMLTVVLPTQASLQGTVSDSSGAAIPAALVMVHWDSSGSRTGLKDIVGISSDVILKADSKGFYSASIPPGFYDVFVSSPAFSPQCRKVRVRQDQVIVYSPKLEVDPLIVKELGDTFPTN
jgi:hypothetical protein